VTGDTPDAKPDRADMIEHMFPFVTFIQDAGKQL
jgi:hypothetical protein